MYALRSLIIMAILSTAGIAAAADRLAMDDLVALAKTRTASLRTVDITFDRIQEAPDELLKQMPVIPHIQRRMVFDIPSGRFHQFNSHPDDKSGKLVQDSEFAHDGKTTTSYAHDSQQGGISNKTKRDPFRDAAPLAGALLYQPKTVDSFGIDDGSMLGILAHGTVRDKNETINGHDCYVVDGMSDKGRYTTLWIDAEKGGSPIKSVIYNKQGGAGITAEFDDLRSVPDGHGGTVWLPMTVKYLSALHGKVVTITERIHPDSLRINPEVPVDMYAVQFPPGTTVSDDTAGVTFEVPGAPSDNLPQLRLAALTAPAGERSGAKPNVADDTQKRAAAAPLPAVATAPFSGQSTAARVGMALCGIALAIGIVLVLVRARRKGQQS
jgi:hypothetical protein